MRVGIVGAGWVTRYHLAAWSRLDGVAVAAICDPDRSAAETRAAAHGIPAVFGGLEAMLEDATLDALDICSPREFHAAQARAGAQKGLAVICQKPLGVDLAEAEALVRDVAGRVPFMVHENWRFRPYYRRLKAWLEEGVVGDLVSVRLEFHSSGMIADADGRRPALVRQPFLAGLRRMLVMEILIHHLDTLRFLLGELVLDAARLGRSNPDIAGEDSAVLSLHRAEDRLPLHVSGNLAVHGAPPAPTDQLWIYGSRGTVHLDGSTLHLYAPSPRTEAFDAEASYQAAYDGAIAHFVAGLAGGVAFETNPHDNLETLRLVEAAYRASGLGTGGGV